MSRPTRGAVGRWIGTRPPSFRKSWSPLCPLHVPNAAPCGWIRSTFASRDSNLAQRETQVRLLLIRATVGYHQLAWPRAIKINHNAPEVDRTRRSPADHH